MLGVDVGGVTPRCLHHELPQTMERSAGRSGCDAVVGRIFGLVCLAEHGWDPELGGHPDWPWQHAGPGCG